MMVIHGKDMWYDGDACKQKTCDMMVMHGKSTCDMTVMHGKNTCDMMVIHGKG